MISRHLPAPRPALLVISLGIAIGTPLPAVAGELMPFEIPEEEVQWDKIDLEEFNTSLPTIDTTPQTEKPAPPPGPDWPPPAIDAYVDASFSDTDVANLGYSETPGGYRFIAGFRLDTPRFGDWSVAGEFGYTRLGRAERKTVNPVIPTGSWDLQTTDTFTTDLSAIDFGTRIGYTVLPRIEVFARGGMQFYHVADKTVTFFDFTPKNNQVAPADYTDRPASVSDAKVNVYGSLGTAIRLGKVPQIYAEYGARGVSGGTIYTGNVGFLLNF